jgi:hypothetical protein
MEKILVFGAFGFRRRWRFSPGKLSTLRLMLFLRLVFFIRPMLFLKELKPRTGLVAVVVVSSQSELGMIAVRVLDYIVTATTS